MLPENNKTSDAKNQVIDIFSDDGFDIIDDGTDVSIESARKFAEDGKIDEAKLAYDSLIKVLPLPEIYNEAADFYHKNGENEYAVGLYEKALVSVPEDKLYLDNYARTLCAISQFKKCEDYLLARIRKGKSTVTTYYWLGESLRLQGKTRAAQTAYLVALRMSPEDIMLRLALVTLASEIDPSQQYNSKSYQDAMEACINGDIDNAVQLLKEAVMLTSISPLSDDPANEEGLEEVLSSITNGSEDLPELQEIVAISEKELNPQKIILLAKIKLVENNIEKALQIVGKGVADFPEDEDLPVFYSKTLEKRSINEALEYLEGRAKILSTSFKIQAYCGKLQIDAGKYKESLQTLTRAYQLEPEEEQNNKNLIEACRMTNNLSMAIEVVRKNILSHGHSEEALLLIGNLMSQMHNISEASSYFEMAQKHNLASSKGLLAQAKMFADNDMLRDSVIVLRGGLEQHQNDLDFLVQYATILYKDGQITDSADTLRKVLAKDPANTKAKRALADILLLQGAYPEAARFYRDLLQLDKDSSELMVVLAETYELSGNDDDAKKLYQSAIDKNSKFLKAKQKLGFCRLRQEEFSQGVEAYEIISSTVPCAHKWKKSVPIWKGESIKDKILVLYQNVSDAETIMFARYFEYLKRMGAKLELLVNTNLVSLLSSFADATTDYPRPADYCLPISAIPKIFNINFSRMPNSRPYIKPDQLIMGPWNNLLGGSNKKRVGLVWRSEKEKKQMSHYDRVSSIELSSFSELIHQNSEFDFISLQTGKAGLDEEQSHNLPMRSGGQITSNLADLACGISKVDLLITTDQTTAHIAGAMEVDALVLLPSMASWCWFTGREDSPWYPSLTLHRQQLMGDWHPLIMATQARLKLLREAA